MSGPEAAKEALRQLSCAEPADTPALLGPDVDAAAAARAWKILCETLANESRVDQALRAMHDRVHREWPEKGPQRRAGLLALMAARGTARRHTPMPFDRAALLALMD